MVANNQNPAVKPVGDHPTQRREQPDREERSGGDQAGPAGAAGASRHEDADRHGLHPRTDVGQHGGPPDKGEVAVLERAESTQHGRRSAYGDRQQRETAFLPWADGANAHRADEPLGPMPGPS